ncbi:MAG: trypsin-like serine protease [Phycisphaerales bacterium]|nr:trypsin-like serine protease [Phycisphaerales bacterium]
MRIVAAACARILTWMPRRQVLATLLILWAALGAMAQSPPAPAGSIETIEEAIVLQDRIREVYKKSLQAVVGLVVHLDETHSSTGSGVVISADGWILTAGHVCVEPGLKVDVFFADGSRTEGKTAGLRFEGQEDCGLVRFETAGVNFTVLELGNSVAMHAGDWVLGFGHTYGVYSDPWHPPAVRLGRIRNNRGDVLDMDAPISSGDSGGPLLNLQGQVVGVLASGGSEPWIGSSTSADLVKRVMDSMRVGERTGKQAMPGEELTRLVTVASAPPSREGNESREDPVMLAALSPLIDVAGESTVGIMVGGAEVGLGLAVDGGYVLAKSSDVGMTDPDLAIALPDGLVLSATRVAKDDARDLLLIWAGEGTELEPILFSSAAPPEPGSILVSPGRTLAPLALGVMSMQPLATGIYDILAPYMGVMLARAPEGIAGAHLAGVMSGGSAFKAGLLAGDVVTRIGAEVVVNDAAFGVALRHHGIGEVVEFVIDRDGIEMKIQVRMGLRELTDSPASSTPAVPASRRASGFGEVLQHDSVLGAPEIGGALVDLEGNVVGMNIARVDRTKTYALSAPVVAQAVKQLISSADPKKPLPLQDPLDGALAVLEHEGVITLSAETAEIMGTNARYELVPQSEGENAAGVIAGWMSGLDYLRWCVAPERAGQFAVSVIQSCPEGGGGGSFTVRCASTKEGGELKGDVMVTSGETTFTSNELGVIDLPAGRSFLEVKPIRVMPGGLMRLRKLILKRIG